MINTTEVVNELVRDTPLLEDGIRQGIINYSALAREIRPELEKRLMRPVQRGAIIMALKRITGDLRQAERQIKPAVAQMILDMTVRSQLIEFTYAVSDSIVAKQKELFTFVEERKDTFCNLSQGIRELTMIVSKDIRVPLERIFRAEKLLDMIEDLASITIRFQKEIVDIPGVYYYILKLLAWQGVTIIEVVSTSTELTIVFKADDIDRAFSLLKGSRGSNFAIV